jgi:lipopolysaccharide/colanic/teichoic acid biosynthesis glycosyltransferase
LSESSTIFVVPSPARRPRTPEPQRPYDVLLAASLLIFFAPLLAVVLALTFLQDGGSPLFAQLRIGRGGRRFRCWKIRSMVLDADARLAALLEADAQARLEWARDHKLRNDPRITPFGRFLRKSSLDELPQLFNVLLGDMSLVGPRPIVDAEICKYGRYFPAYCSVKPGLTGLWQISGRNDVSYRRRIALDVSYARQHRLTLDMYILVATIPAVFLRRGAR